MEGMREGLYSAIARLVAEAAKTGEEEALLSLEKPKGQFGDVSSKIAFDVAKREKKSPVEIAKGICARIGKHEWVEKAVATGPYVNFLLTDAFYAALAVEVADFGEEFGKGDAKEGKVLIEFPSVNPNKPWHIGHLRNALLGDSIARLLSFGGENVERQDYIDDLGLQVAQSVYGYSKFGEGKSKKKFDHLLGEQYVKIAKMMEDKEEEAQVRKMLHELEGGKSAVCIQARHMVERCVLAQYETAYKFGIYHDVLVFESDIVHNIFKEGLALLRTNSAIVQENTGKNAGCLVAKMEGEEFEGMTSPDKVLIRSDGTATYTGKDVIFQLWKFGKLNGKFKYAQFAKQPNGKECYKTSENGKEMGFGNAQKVVNVIGMEQAYPQKVIAEIFRLMGFAQEAKNSIHLSYEHVGLAEGKFSGREGSWMGFTADELFEEGERRAMEKIKGEMGEGEKKKVAHAVAAGAIRFAFVGVSSQKKIVFDWDKALSLEGDSAPYVMYAHARCARILEKAKGLEEGEAGTYSYNKEERELLKAIMELPLAAQKAASEYQPHILCDYLVGLASMLNKFYNVSPVLASDVPANAKAARLQVVQAAKVALANGLGAIGIEAIERM
ncbi:Arginine--tRNA ligase [Candidatus Anstonella stagnisolia]|nr:Arginine--tRNA ligase [Candidatus Anstonella stagnisolia]